MTPEERAVADELLRQAGCEPVGSPLLGPWSNVLQPDYEWGMGIPQMLAQMYALEEMRDVKRSRKTDFMRAAMEDASERVAADDRHMAAWREKTELRGPEVSSPVIDEVEYRHKEYAYSYQYRKELDEAPAPAPRRRPAWLQPFAEAWLALRWMLSEWIEPK